MLDWEARCGFFFSKVYGVIHNNSLMLLMYFHLVVWMINIGYGGDILSLKRRVGDGIWCVLGDFNAIRCLEE